MSKKHIIRNAYDAYWFIYNHPDFKTEYRSPILSNDPDELEKNRKKYILSEFEKSDGTILYQKIIPNIFHRALVENIDIYYAKVDETGVINDDRTLNTNIECWLELGPMKWTSKECWEEGWSDRPYLQPVHDIRLDCGGKTFDEALVKLARLLKKYYGDYEGKE